ncbi:ABC transporter ATP-binding protein [Nocardiopsis sp. HNM0947]|uniref:ABC transporter ATP-binding protein n=1 Tax=Nocardiopsis coralli TaxID=2772213 RepID=A0ABR9P998_9ACTN|nr:ABC transporter ATP-binding protein [Nocardiopsis coralli]MBE3000419.1 ABC transporter ATP-binding protein [Nocardiopsis coralli]
MIEAHGIGFHHPGGDWLFRGLTLTVPPGAVTCVMGPNGRGKTTLMRCLSGLLAPKEGFVVREEHVAHVPQASPSTFAFSVLDMVLMGRARSIGTFSRPRASDVRAARSALRRVGTLELAERPFTELSGGQRQLVLVARALCSGHRTLMLDEPASALDVRNQGALLRVSRELADEGYAVLMNTHHPDHAAWLADRAVLMHTDRVETGSAAELITGPALTELFALPVSTHTVPEGRGERVLVAPHYGS